MKKVLFQFFISAGLFLSIFWLLSRIDFMRLSKLPEFGRKQADRLSELMVESILTSHDEIKNDTLKAMVDSIKFPLCAAGGLDPEVIKIHLIKESDVNAFALPGNHIIVHSALFDFAKNEEEFAGVLSHELGHIKLDHIQQKLIKEFGHTLLFTLAGGEGGQEIIKQILQTISSTSFDRNYEREADQFAVKVLMEMGISPERLSDFMLRMADQNRLPSELVFLSTHPDSRERAAEIIRSKGSFKGSGKKILRTPWNSVKALAH